MKDDSPHGSLSGAQVAEEILTMFREKGDEAYVGEAVSQTEHALQAAWEAEKTGASAELIVAALLHDVGHLLHDLGEDFTDRGIDDRHEILGRNWLKKRFGTGVTVPVEQHVAAKRYLCTVDSAYQESLSPASLGSLQLQGGPFTQDEVAQFQQIPEWENCVALRHWDDVAKIPGLATPPLEHFCAYIIEAVENPSNGSRI